MKKLIINLLFIVGIYITPSLGASIQSDPKPVKSSSVSWTAGKVTGTHSGIITLDKSYLEMDGDRLVGGRIVVNMNSIIVTDLEGKSKSNLEGHLKSEDFFSVASHPKASLEITDAKFNDDGSQNVNGNITIKGITQPINFNISFKNNYATTSLTIDRTKFGIRYGSGSFFDNLGDKAINDDFEIRAKLEL